MSHARWLFTGLLLTCLLFRASAQRGLFDSDSTLDILLSGNMRELLNDRGAKPTYHQLTLAYPGDTGAITIPCRVKTRGHFRKAKSNCVYPPLMLQFSRKDQSPGSLFYAQDKLKLVMPCQGDEYVVREWLVYRLYNLVTPKSFRARLVRVTLADQDGKRRTPFYGILLEDEKSMARRNQLISVERMKLRPEYTDRKQFLTMAVFEYMIGNTDWSVQYMQNIKFIAADSLSTPFTVPYDFDHAGIVSAPYAKPAEELQMNSVRERRYRGFCISEMKIYEPVLEQFRQLKQQFYELYSHCNLVDERYVRTVTAFLDEFFATINDPKRLARDFTYPCDPNGTGNVVIKGMRDD
jgi:hypothetical protein